MSYRYWVALLPVDFESLDAATLTVLDSFVPDWVRYIRVERTRGLVVYCLLGDDAIGDYGSIMLRKLQAGRCELRFSDPSTPKEREWTPEETAAADQVPELDEYDRYVGAVALKIRQERDDLRRAKQERHDATIKAFLQRLPSELVIDVIEPLPRVRAGRGRPQWRDHSWADFELEMQKAFWSLYRPGSRTPSKPAVSNCMSGKMSKSVRTIDNQLRDEHLTWKDWVAIELARRQE